MVKTPQHARGHRIRPVVHTGCGRELTIGHVHIPGSHAPLGRVTLEVSCTPEDLGQSRVWASLSPAEARELAKHLTAQAAAAETGTDRSHEARRIEVGFTGGEAYTIKVGGHEMTVDQPIASGGADLAPTPTELFVASLASCTAAHVGRFLSRHGIGREGTAVTALFEMAEGSPPDRVSAVRLVVRAPDLPPEHRAGLQAEAEQCVVHTALHHPPQIAFDIG